MVNVELLEKLYRWAVASQKSLDKFWEENPDWAKHNQGNWGQVVKNGTCQTAFCLAGQVAVQEGYTFVLSKDDWDEQGSVRMATGAAMVPKSKVHSLGLHFVRGSGKSFAWGERAEILNFYTESGESRYASEIATEALGITDNEANLLFNGGNTVEDIRHFINGIFINHGIDKQLSAAAVE